MRIARVSTLAVMIWIGLFMGVLAMAQRPTLAPETIPPRPPQPEASSAPLQTPQDGIFRKAEPLSAGLEASQAGVCLDGGTYGACALGPCCAVCGGGSTCPPDWYTHQRVRMWTRSRPRRHQLSGSFDVSLTQTGQDDEGNAFWRATAVPLAVQMTNRSVNFSPATGWDMVIGRYLGRDTENRDHFLEFEYSGLMSWRESMVVRGKRTPFYTDLGPLPPDTFPSAAGFQGNLTSAFPVITPEQVAVGLASPAAQLLSNVFNQADQHTQIYDSDIDSFELNLRLRPRGRSDRLVLHPNGKWRRECRPGEYISYVFGLRMISIDEQFRFQSNGSRQKSNGRVTALTNGEYGVRTHNDMIGLQFGTDWIIRKCKWTYGLRAKIGPLINFTDARARIEAAEVQYNLDGTSDDFPVFIQASARKNTASLLGEFGVLTTYKLNPHLTLEASYDFMWLVGLALAPEQLRFDESQSTEVNTNGHIYFHGLTLGAEFSY